MWEIFKSKEKKEKEALQREAKRKQEEANAIAFKKEYQSTLDLLQLKVREENTKSYEIQKSYAERTNSTCPKCKGKNVIDKIQRLQGEIHGSSSIYGSGNLFHSSISGSGSIDGKIDTNEINCCKDCGNEWKKVKSTDYSYKSLSDKIDRFVYHVRGFYNAYHCTFDPKDIHEKYNSLEEKRTDLIKREKGFTFEEEKKFFEGCSYKVLKLICEENRSYSYSGELKYFDKEILKNEYGIRE